jgi:hypothetical protein
MTIEFEWKSCEDGYCNLLKVLKNKDLLAIYNHKNFPSNVLLSDIYFRVTDNRYISGV